MQAKQLDFKKGKKMLEKQIEWSKKFENAIAALNNRSTKLHLLCNIL